MATNESINSQKIDLEDVVETKARQLRSLLFMTYGEQATGAGFRGMSDQLQDAYMWACADIADDIVNALDKITTLKVEKAGVQHA